MKVETITVKAKRGPAAVCDECRQEPGNDGQIGAGEKRLLMEGYENGGVRIGKCVFHGERYLKGKIEEFKGLMKELKK